MENIDLSTWLKIIGAFLSGIGSLILAWRVKIILKWISYTLAAHEMSIIQLIRILNGQNQNHPTVTGAQKHLMNVEDRLGFTLLIIGFFCLGIGMIINSISFLI